MPVEGGRRVGAYGLWAAGRRSIGWAAGAFVAVLVVFRLVVLVRDQRGDLAFDFRQFWHGARDVVNGVSPYPSAELLATAGDYLGSVGIQEVFRFPYPAGAAVALSPLGLLGFNTAAVVWSCLLVACTLGALRILGVRDWRVYAVALTSVPVLSAVYLGTLTPVLLLLAAVVWRWRDRRLVAGSALGLAICLKLFLWPLAVWLVATRRYAAAAIAVVLATAATFVAWAAIGFAGLAEYPDLVRRLTDVVADRGYSLVAFGVELGLPVGVAEALPWVVGLGMLAAVFVAVRRGRSEELSYSLAVVAAIALTPIVWHHYFALLVVPLAFARPRISWAWGLLWVFWLVPAQENQGGLWRIVLVYVLVGVAFAITAGVQLPRRLSPARAAAR